MAILESELIDRVKPFFEFKYNVFQEVALFNRSIDIVLTDFQELITIEFKINDWNRAIKQIEGHMVAADYAYLCMPKRKTSEKMLNNLSVRGIGLWLYDIDSDHIEERLSPQKSSIQWEFYKESLIKRLSGRETI